MKGSLMGSPPPSDFSSHSEDFPALSATLSKHAAASGNATAMMGANGQATFAQHSGLNFGNSPQPLGAGAVHADGQADFGQHSQSHGHVPVSLQMGPGGSAFLRNFGSGGNSSSSTSGANASRPSPFAAGASSFNSAGGASAGSSNGSGNTAAGPPGQLSQSQGSTSYPAPSATVSSWQGQLARSNEVSDSLI